MVFFIFHETNALEKQDNGWQVLKTSPVHDPDLVAVFKTKAEAQKKVKKLRSASNNQTENKIISPIENDKRIDTEARKQAKRIGIPFSSTGKTSKERYFFIQGVKSVGVTSHKRKNSRVNSHRRSKPRRR